jgi:hypothetical protein
VGRRVIHREGTKHTKKGGFLQYRVKSACRRAHRPGACGTSVSVRSFTIITVKKQQWPREGIVIQETTKRFRPSLGRMTIAVPAQPTG